MQQRIRPVLGVCPFRAICAWSYNLAANVVKWELAGCCAGAWLGVCLVFGISCLGS